MNNLDRAMLILGKLEGIRTPENTSDDGRTKVNYTLLGLRQLIQVVSQQYPAAGWTGCVALTLLKIGACQELVQRFAIEYFLQFNKPDVSIIFSANGQDLSNDNHCFVLIGDVKVDDGLIVGRGDRGTCFGERKSFIPIIQFLRNQPRDTVVADPLLGFTDTAQASCAALVDYCSRHNITHVVGVRNYPASFVENASMVMENARKICAIVSKRFAFL